MPDECGVCGKAFVADDIIPINGTQEQVQALQGMLNQRRLKAPKKSKKRKSTAGEDALPKSQKVAESCEVH